MRPAERTLETRNAPMPELTGESIMPGESTSMMFLRFRSLRTCTKGVWYALQLLVGQNVRANK